MKMIESYMTTTEAASYLKCDPDYVCGLCIAGKLSGAKKFGRAWAIPEESVIFYGNNRTKKLRERTTSQVWLNKVNAAIKQGKAMHEERKENRP